MFALASEPIPSTQVHPPETSVAERVTEAWRDTHAWQNEVCPSFRHSGWALTRQRIYDAMLREHVSDSRLTAFASCGGSCWLQQNRDNPDQWRIVVAGCNDRFCTPCSRERSSILQSNVIDAIGDTRQRMITLTLRSTNDPLHVQLTRLVKCFKALRQTPAWQTHVAGGIAMLEITWSPERQQWHPHLHAITHGTYWLASDLSSAWYDATGDSQIVHITLLRNPEHAAKYVAKYATKALPETVTHDAQLMGHVLHAFAGRRLLIQFGDWHKRAFLTRPTDHQWATLGSVYDALRRSDLPAHVEDFASQWLTSWSDRNHKTVITIEQPTAPP